MHALTSSLPLSRLQRLTTWQPSGYREHMPFSAPEKQMTLAHTLHWRYPPRLVKSHHLMAVGASQHSRGTLMRSVG